MLRTRGTQPERGQAALVHVWNRILSQQKYVWRSAALVATKITKVEFANDLSWMARVPTGSRVGLPTVRSSSVPSPTIGLSLAFGCVR